MLTKWDIIKTVPGAVYHREPLAPDQISVLIRDAAGPHRTEDDSWEGDAKPQFLHDALTYESSAGATALIALAQIPHRKAHAEDLWALCMVLVVVSAVPIIVLPGVVIVSCCP